MHWNHWWGMGWMGLFWGVILLGAALFIVWLVRSVTRQP